MDIRSPSPAIRAAEYENSVGLLSLETKTEPAEFEPWSDPPASRDRPERTLPTRSRPNRDSIRLPLGALAYFCGTVAMGTPDADACADATVSSVFFSTAVTVICVPLYIKVAFVAGSNFAIVISNVLPTAGAPGRAAKVKVFAVFAVIFRTRPICGPLVMCTQKFFHWSVTHTFDESVTDVVVPAVAVASSKMSSSIVESTMIAVSPPTRAEVSSAICPFHLRKMSYLLPK